MVFKIYRCLRDHKILQKFHDCRAHQYEDSKIKGRFQKKSPDLTRPTVLENQNNELQLICDNIHVYNNAAPIFPKYFFYKTLIDD